MGAARGRQRLTGVSFRCVGDGDAWCERNVRGGVSWSSRFVSCETVATWVRMRVSRRAPGQDGRQWPAGMGHLVALARSGCAPWCEPRPGCAPNRRRAPTLPVLPRPAAARGVPGGSGRRAIAFEGPLSVNYRLHMIEVRQTSVFRVWLDDLADRRAVERIAHGSCGCRRG